MAGNNADLGAAQRASSLRVSAPGKVLLTGGYLILEERFSGLVLATTARFHTTISRRAKASASPDSALLQLCIESPQFAQIIHIGIETTPSGQLGLRIGDTSDRNGYIEETLLCTMNGLMALDATRFARMCDELRAQGEELHILLEADNAFYSQAKRLQQLGKSLCRRHLEELPAFLPPLMDGKSIAKTGLGSSAALITSLVGAITHFILGVDGSKADATSRLDLIHNLAQLSHCFVQRKIGSGFDVSTACYGSQRYSRFPPPLLDAFTTHENLHPSAIAECVRDQARWNRNKRVTHFAVPSNFHLLMGDVSTGSATVSMVKQVLQWQRANPSESERVVTALAAHNAAVEVGFQRLMGLHAANESLFAETCVAVATVPADQWSHAGGQIGCQLYALRCAYAQVRGTFREMGELAGVPIEPPEQKDLIDATMALPGVLFAGVPGAGGYDALFVLTLDEAALDKVEALWLCWTETHPDAVICPLLCDVAASSTLDAGALVVEELH